MSDWFAKLTQEWSVISGAPTSFAAAVVVAICIIWAVVNWSYRTVLSNKDAQIELLNGRVAAYQDRLKGASPDEAAERIKRLEGEIDALKNPPRDQNAIYQNNRAIGAVAGINIDASKKLVSFQQMTVAGSLDQATNVEFRNLIMSFVGSDGFSQARQGLAGTTTYYNARFSVVGNRLDNR